MSSSTLGFPPEEAENLKIRAHLMGELRESIRQCELRQAEAAELLGVTQPRISDLTRGKIERFRIDALVSMLAMAGAQVTIHVEPAPPRAAQPKLIGGFPPMGNRRIL
ncbi:MAG: XRE family transcriptional regulator [Gemmatimonadetes bacterium]|jgi:predicted XRE-type DNA-binding protein|nr:XRE family transcriptional regulator [Gemmatimonadota bacterium]